MNKVGHINWGVLPQLLSKFILTFVVLFFAWRMGEMVFLLLMQDEQAEEIRWTPKQSNSSYARPSTSSPSEQAQKLFGSYQEESLQIEPQPDDMPETKLNVKLIGISALKDPKAGSIIIANQGAQQTYSVGEKISGTQAKVKAIYPIRAVINNAGVDEVLSLEDDFKPTNNNIRQKASRNNTSATRTSVSMDSNKKKQVLDKIKENPKELFRYVKFSNINGQNGKLDGLKVSPGRDSEIFEQLGFKPGDIVKEVNGTAISVTGMPLLYKNIYEQDSISLLVERDGQTNIIDINF